MEIGYEKKIALDFPKLDDERWKLNIYCRREGNGVSAAPNPTVIMAAEKIADQIK